MILVLWINFVAQNVEVRQYTHVIDIVLHLSDYPDIPGSILYEIARGLQSFISPKTPIRFNSDIMKYIMEKAAHHESNIYSRPKWLAAIFMLDNVFVDASFSAFIYNNFPIEKIEENYLLADKTYWQELPYLLRELINRGNNETVKKALKHITLHQDALASQEIYDYINIANGIGDISFLQRIYEFLSPDIYHEHFNWKVFLYVTYILQGHSISCINKLKNIFSSYLHMIRLTNENPVTMTRLITLLYSQSNISKVFDALSFEQIFNSIILQLPNTFTDKPQVAIDFLHTVALDRDNRAANKSHVQSAIRKLINQAMLTDQIEAANQLQKLLEL